MSQESRTQRRNSLPHSREEAAFQPYRRMSVPTVSQQPLPVSEEDLRQRVKVALERVKRTTESLKQFFASIEEKKLDAYQRPRLNALMEEANAIVTANNQVFAETPFDLIRILRRAARQDEWLFQLFVECQNVLAGQ